MQKCNPEGTKSINGEQCECNERWSGNLCNRQLGWGNWSEWGSCDAACGSGVKTRQVINAALKNSHSIFQIVYTSLFVERLF